MNFFELIINILTIIGSLTIFLFGMKLMSSALQKIAGGRFQHALDNFTSRPISGFFTGFLSTALVQSSSVTTLLIVSLTGAGMINVSSAISVVIGANVGTTITAWIVSIIGFRLDFSMIIVAIAAFALPLIFSKKRIKQVSADAIIGFALMFISLSLMRSVIPEFGENSSFINSIVEFNDLGFLSILFFAVVGLILTAFMQSSSAIFILILVLCSNGYISLYQSFAMILGMNLGTTVTANLASMFVSRDGKIVARFHVLFNLIALVWGLLFFSWFSFFVEQSSLYFTGGVLSMPIALSLYHTLLNLINAFLLIGFIPLLTRISTYFVHDKKSDLEKNYDDKSINYISNSFISSLSVGQVQIQKKVVLYSKKSLLLFSSIPELLLEKRPAEYQELLEKILDYRKSSEKSKNEIRTYLKDINSSESTMLDSDFLFSTYDMVLNLDRFSDFCFQMSQSIEMKNCDKIYFLPELRENIFEMFDLLTKSQRAMHRSLIDPFSSTISDANICEENLNNKKRVLFEKHTLDLKNKKYKYRTGSYYIELVLLVENAGNCLYNISKLLNNNELKNS